VDRSGLAQAVEQWDEWEPGVDHCLLQTYAAQFAETEFARQMKPILFEASSDFEASSHFETNSYNRAFRRANHSMTAPKISIEMPQ